MRYCCLSSIITMCCCCADQVQSIALLQQILTSVQSQVPSRCQSLVIDVAVVLSASAVVLAWAQDRQAASEHETTRGWMHQLNYGSTSANVSMMRESPVRSPCPSSIEPHNDHFPAGMREDERDAKLRGTATELTRCLHAQRLEQRVLRRAHSVFVFIIIVGALHESEHSAPPTSLQERRSYVVRGLLRLVALFVGARLGFVGLALRRAQGLPPLTEELADLA